MTLYAEDALLSTELSRDPNRGRDGVREYVAMVFGEEKDPVVVVSAPIVDARRAAVSWWASLREDGVDTTLAGTSVLEFDADGLVVEQWDTWNQVSRRLGARVGALRRVRGSGT